MAGTYTDKDGHKRYIGSDRLVQRGGTPKKTADGSDSSEYETHLKDKRSSQTTKTDMRKKGFHQKII